MIAACRQEKVDQEFIKSKCGHNILLDHCILDICLILIFQVLNMQTTGIWAPFRSL